MPLIFNIEVGGNLNACGYIVENIAENIAERRKWIIRKEQEDESQG